jgi:hypothetical protein
MTGAPRPSPSRRPDGAPGLDRMLLRRSLSTALAVLALQLPAGALAQAAARSTFDVAPWQAILDRYLTPTGRFRYGALHDHAGDRAALDAFVARVGEAELEAMSRDARFAFYVNAYNALTVRSVLDRWPVSSVMEEDGFFDGRRHRVAGRRLTLNELENDVLRPRFGDPRVHFAINCASVGCPPLSRQAFTAANVRLQLARLTRAFVRRSTRLERGSGTVRVSRIFEWFAGDFDAQGGVRAFVASQLPEADAAFVRDAGTRVAFSPYDWSLNGARDAAVR